MPRQGKRETAEVVDGQGTTALMRAAQAGDDYKMHVLLQAGAQANAVDHYGKTPLMYVADGDSRDGAGPVALLLAFRANIDAVDEFGNCALMRAALADNWAMVAILRSHGANMHLANCYGTTPEDVWRFMCQDSDSNPVSEPDGDAEDAPPLVIPGKPLPATAPAPVDVEGETGYCWHVADDVLNQAFDAGTCYPLGDDMLQTPSAEAVGTRFESP